MASNENLQVGWAAAEALATFELTMKLAARLCDAMRFGPNPEAAKQARDLFHELLHGARPRTVEESVRCLETAAHMVRRILAECPNEFRLAPACSLAETPTSFSNEAVAASSQ